MLKKYVAIFFLGAMAQSCSAEDTNSGTIGFSVGSGAKLFFSSHYSDDQNLGKREDFKNLRDLDWYERYDVNDENGSLKSIRNCSELILGKESYSESIPAQYSTFRYYLTHCLAIEKVIESKDSKKSFLPKQIVSADSPSILPKEFIPVVSKSDQEALDAMPSSARWGDGIQVSSTEDLGNNRIRFNQEVQTQILSELARADFNDDGLEDSLVYLRTTMNGGSWESDQIITLTAGEDGVIKTLDVFPKN